MLPHNLETRASASDSRFAHAPNNIARSAPKRGISDAFLRGAKPRTKSYKIGVGGSVYLEVMPNGPKLWRWKYHLGGIENRYAMGAYPDDLMLKAARKEAEKAHELVKLGIHPSHQKQLNKIKMGHEHANTLEAIAKEWLAPKDWEQVTKDRRLTMLERVVFPGIGKLPVRQIASAHILDITTVRRFL